MSKLSERLKKTPVRGIYAGRDRIYIILFFITFAIILFARIYRFCYIPGDINQDEAFAGYNAFTLLERGKDSFGYSFPMYLTAWGSGMNALESYLSIPFVALFGLHTYSIRLIPLICAVFSLLAVYKMCRDHIGRVFALFVFFIAGIMPWHIMLSRWALESNLAPSFLIFGLYFFIKGMDNDKFFILSAVFYGLSLYSYATIWAVVPFIILFQIIYLIWCKKISISVYTIVSVIILALFALPAILFLLVNKDIISEIRTPFISIPKMIYFRGDEISFDNISDNIKNLYNILSTGTDGLPWNATDKYGMLYIFILPFSGIGILCAFINIIRGMGKGKKREFHIEIIFLIQLLAGLVTGALITVNINRVNIIFFPIIIFASYGWYTLLTIYKNIKYYALIIPVIIYAVSFIGFEYYYFTEYKDIINPMFCEGLESVMSYTVNELGDYDKVYVTPNANYARILYFSGEDLDEYISTVEYTNYPSAFLDVSAFGRYDFTPDGGALPDGTSLYLLDSSYDDTPLVNGLISMGYTSYSDGYYTVYYPG